MLALKRTQENLLKLEVTVHQHCFQYATPVSALLLRSHPMSTS